MSSGSGSKLPLVISTETRANDFEVIKKNKKTIL